MYRKTSFGIGEGPVPGTCSPERWLAQPSRLYWSIGGASLSRPIICWERKPASRECRRNTRNDTKVGNHRIEALVLASELFGVFRVFRASINIRIETSSTNSQPSFPSHPRSMSLRLLRFLVGDG